MDKAQRKAFLLEPGKIICSPSEYGIEETPHFQDILYINTGKRDIGLPLKDDASLLLNLATFTSEQEMASNQQYLKFQMAEEGFRWDRSQKDEP